LVPPGSCAMLHYCVGRNDDCGLLLLVLLVQIPRWRDTRPLTVAQPFPAVTMNSEPMKDEQKDNVKCFSYRTLTVVELATENSTNTRSSSMSLCPE